MLAAVSYGLCQFDGLSYFSDIVPVPQQIPPDTDTAVDPVHNDLEFLDDPSHAEEDGIPAAVYDKPMSDEEEEDGVFKFGPPGIVFQSVYTMSLYGHFIWKCRNVTLLW